MLCKLRSYALQVKEQCSVTYRIMLRNLKNNALCLLELCFWALGALLLGSKNNAFGV